MIFWNGNGISMLSEAEREQVERGETADVRAGALSFDEETHELWLEGKHVIGLDVDTTDHDDLIDTADEDAE